MAVIDITGQKFGRLTAIRYVGKGKWLFKCDCGKEHITRGSVVRNGLVVSCGCYHREIIKNIVPYNKTHGMGKSPEYNIWSMMKNRCTNPKCNRHQYYLDKGIRVCDRWLGEHGFENFVADMGMRPSPKHSIDRIDPNGDYCPENCRWATPKEQSNNQTSNVVIEHNGEKKTLAQWCEFYDFPYKLAHSRLKRGFSFEEIFTKGAFSNKGRECGLHKKFYAKEGFKVCVKCEQEFPLSEFYQIRSTGGYDCYCKKCRNISNRLYKKHTSPQK